MHIGVQTMGIVANENPWTGFELLKNIGFDCVDFSLQEYLSSENLYQGRCDKFFSKTSTQLEEVFRPHKQAVKDVGICVNQMHMPFPLYVPGGEREINDYLKGCMMPRSMEICAFFDCPYIVVHGVRLSHFLGSEEAEWQVTENFLDSIAPLAKEMGITICLENLYGSISGHLVEGPCCNIGKTVERIERFNDKYGEEVLAFCLDTGHANLLGVDFFSWIMRLGKHLKVLHIHDNDGRGDCHQIPFTFTSSRKSLPSTDWNGFCQGLREINFDGVLNFETGPSLSTFPEELHEDMLRMIFAIGRYFAFQIER